MGSAQLAFAPAALRLVEGAQSALAPADIVYQLTEI